MRRSDSRGGVAGKTACAGWLLGVALSAVLAGASGPSPILAPEARRAVVTELAAGIEGAYFDAEAAPRIAGELRRRLGAGAYDPFVEPRDLAGRLTAELKEVNTHFLVIWQPPDAEAPPPGAHDAEAEAYWLAWSRRHNFGFRKVEILAGNVGYLDLRYFDSPDHAVETAAAAMKMLSGADAVLVDLRQNGGGEPEMVQLLASYFLGPEPVLYNIFHSRGDGETRQLWTLGWAPGERLLDAPLYVLVSARTGSAAESFSYAMKQAGRATLVGERTAGAANPGESLPLVHGFSVFMPTGRPVHPKTGTNWEKTGVEPDVEAPALDALDTAYGLALRDLVENPTTKRLALREVSWALEAWEARGAPAALPPGALADYAGSYGNRQIRVEAGRLVYQKGRRTPRLMVPLGDDRFLLEGVESFRVRFERNAEGRIIRAVDLWSDGHVEANARE